MRLFVVFRGRVFLPLMPKGVEHYAKARWKSPRNHVFLPLMPKVVEHFIWRYRTTSTQSVFLPLMPKGVEHLLVFRNCRCPHSCYFR